MYLRSKCFNNRRLAAEARKAFLESLRLLGVDAPDSLRERDTWLTFDGAILRDATSLAGFKAAVRRLQDLP